MARAKELLIVGAGITGSLTASLLARASTQAKVTIWDKVTFELWINPVTDYPYIHRSTISIMYHHLQARGCGGRFTTSYYDNDRSLHVDMGAQYLTRSLNTAESKLKTDVYKELIDGSILTPFHGSIEGSHHCDGDKHYVATKGMSSVCRHFLSSSKANVEFKHCLKYVCIDGKDIVCKTESGLEERSFDGLVLTLPAPQLLQLQGNLLSKTTSDIVDKLSSVKYSSRYALGLFYDAETVRISPAVFNTPWSAKYCDHPVIRYLCWDHLKRGMSSPGATLLAHTSVPFGIEQLSTDKEEVKTLLQEVVKKMVLGLPPPTHSYVLRWRYSQVQDTFPGSHDFVVLSHDPLVVATGDSFSGSNFENCFRAATNISEFITQEFVNI